MMYYDLNVPYTTDRTELQRKIAFLGERKSSIIRIILKGANDTKWDTIPSH